MPSKKKYFVLLLAAVMLIGLLAACSSNNNQSEASVAPSSPAAGSADGADPTNAGNEEATKEAYELILAMPAFGAIPKDIEAVEAEISKIAQAKINATIKILPISIGAWQQQMNLMLSSGEKLDLVFTFGQSYPTQVSSGQILPMDELLSQYGQGIPQAVGEEYLKSAALEGTIYGVPTIHDFGGKYGLVVRKDLADKYQIDLASIKTLDDLEPIFDIIKGNEPGMSPLASGLASPLENMLTYDKLGDRYGVLPGYDNGLKVENHYESAEYADLVNRMHRWFQAGYINKDAATTKTESVDMVKANAAFSYIGRFKPGFIAQESRRTGKELAWVDLQTQHYSTTSDVLLAMWTISQNSQKPERAMMFLDLMYTDKDIANLLLWGIEGKHYVKESDNIIDFPPGIDAATVGYSNLDWLMGNPFITYTNKSQDPEVWNETKAYNEAAFKSKALGFAFNAQPVSNEITALNNVTEQYRKALETGTIDPAQKLPEFIAKLKAAGIDKVIAEKQKQLDAWAAANNK